MGRKQGSPDDAQYAEVTPNAPNYAQCAEVN